MKIPLVSVVIASYNQAKYLGESIESILNQTYQNFELIIIDDASTDNSLKIAEGYQKKDKKIKIIKNKKNVGLALTRNKGLKKVKGKYIAILDADDIALPERLKLQVDFLENNKDIFLVSGGWYTMTKKGTILRRIVPPTKEIDKFLERCENEILGGAIMFKNEKKHFYRYKLAYSEDYDFLLNLLSKGKKLANLKAPLIKYRINESSITHTNRAKMHLFMLKSLEFYKERKSKGKDGYSKWDPNEIFKFDIKKSTDKTLLEFEISALHRAKKGKETREMIKYYSKYYSLFKKPRFFLYYFETYVNLNLIRKLKWFIVNKIKDS